MRSLYKRQLAMMVGIVALSFTLLSTAFMMLSYRYIISEKRDAMERNAGYIAMFASSFYQQLRSEPFQNYVASIALISDSYVIVAAPDGEIIYATDGVNFYAYENSKVPESVVSQVLERGSYAGMTSLGGIFPERRYLASLPITVSLNNLSVTQGLVLVSADASSLAEMWSATATIFFFTAVVVLLIAFVASSLFSAHQARPLNEMAEAARKFGRGEFDVRVTSYEGRCDEISTLAEAFNTMANSLAKVESQRSEFIANVSHELKTPMTTISGFAEGILDGTIPPEREKESLQIVVSETRRLSRLVRRMLDLARLNALTENTVTAQEQFDLTEVVSQVIISLESKITGRNLDVDVQMPDEKLMVWGDPDSITQVCYNLLDNAAKFAAAGTAITVQITKKDGKAYTTIRNLGSTIPKDELPLLFERFHKADYSRSMDREGVGLGLYIVKTILGNLKETITATSEDGVTQFTFTLTLA
ncbi:Alkaline phosphatase synthesis sensor protein phoR [uncultured Flavonifractor sp.]|uniref:sensor histidine kinase n=1 Tax=Eubacteriales TaxID=186802 RepID=UPI0008225080|nr:MULTISPECIES: HAMP domain-containing sensor histidine kinase [Eubacteriales]SCH49847.1 Alkaline phosphatase synthesis sensor protein phoR [uncultured Clostridium sp.]SCI64901.1 Alkaline phosphatase synthesis sensor protein phoR [uncultured Flavonifractor sp.]MCH1978473.1 HAMP domain-containing histidine kinase [Lawsonibacter sp. OA9]MCU6703309.1 HAMP domain-containing histidine kinase [Muriventricola aceti]SCJ42804.1 Alkaline phosphatase synthesis sensor protein phoR [uncultured Flavonifrac